MDKQSIPIAIGLAFAKAPPESIDAGTEFSFSVSLKWPESIGREGARYRVRDGERTIREDALPEPEADGIVGFTLAAPEEAGEHRWTLVVSGAGEEGAGAEGSLPLVLMTVPHATSMAVWDVPSPVVRGTRFEIKVGAKCTACCTLGGREVEVRDETGKVMGAGALGETAWEGTAGLYWTGVPVKAPRKLGLHACSASFSPAELELPHGGATSRFSFVTVAEPAHSVSLKVVDKATKAPIARAQVRLGIYRAVTDEKGTAKVQVPKGEFPLVVTRAGYRMDERSLEVSKDVRLRIAAEALPEEDPFATWTA